MQLRYWMAALLVFCVSVGACADRAEPLSALSKMPVKEITVFKDGHTLVLHEGTMPTDANGYVQMDYLPNPVIGTFWPYSNDKNVTLNSVVASPRKVLVTRTALSLRELLESNPGAEVRVTQMDGTTVDAKVVGVLTRSSEELEALSQPSSGEKLPEKGNIILLKTAEGVDAFPLDTIKAVSFKGDLKRTASDEEFRNLLTLKLDWPNNKPARTAAVGMMYLQKGIRWIPSYKMTLDGKGGATLKLQATLLNELTDLDDVTANLVIGVPSFAFKDTADPIALQQAFAQLSSYFSADSRTNYALSNGLMGQQAGGGGRAGERLGGQPGDPGANLGPELAGSEKNEDLFVFTVKHISLKKGQRMVLPITEIAVRYRDIYTMDLPVAPPQELRGGGAGRYNNQELARLMAAPKAMHVIRLANTSRLPITTAPVLILNGERVLAQAMTTYTAPGGELDLTLTTATDIRVKKTDKEAARTPNAVKWNDQLYTKVDLVGTITVINFTDHPVDLEVTRNVLGIVGRADHDGKAAMVNVFEDDDYAASNERPSWWTSYTWPDWWFHFNGVGRITWKVHLDAGKTVDLGYTWHYFWR
ncbi:MAG: hypothetical protein JWL77_3994 [Chthonomonadaceae bacterium]|nr:hypothetical protein [Chthonomonadaceae bacterium]